MNNVKQYLDIVARLEVNNVNCQICLVIYDPVTGYVNFRSYHHTRYMDYMFATKVVEFSEFKFEKNSLELVLFVNKDEDYYVSSSGEIE